METNTEFSFISKTYIKKATSVGRRIWKGFVITLMVLCVLILLLQLLAGDFSFRDLWTFAVPFAIIYPTLKADRGTFIETMATLKFEDFDLRIVYPELDRRDKRGKCFEEVSIQYDAILRATYSKSANAIEFVGPSTVTSKSKDGKLRTIKRDKQEDFSNLVYFGRMDVKDVLAKLEQHIPVEKIQVIQ